MTDPQTTSGQLLPHCSECGVQRHCFDINNNSSVRDGDNMFCVRCGKKTKVSWYAVSHTNRINEEIRMTQSEGQLTTMTVREQIENIVRESFWGDHKNADKIAPLVDRLESLISNAKEEDAIKRRNIYLFFAATIYRLNNPDTAMCIPNGVYISLQEKLSLLPTDRTITESEAMELVKGTPASLSSNNPKV